MKEKLLKLIKYLTYESNLNIDIPNSFEKQKALYKALVNVRNPKKIDEKILKLEDEYLTLNLKDKKITDAYALKEIEKNIILWYGDITTLKCDVIVNPGNNAGLGCFNPTHKCLDNTIHTNAGMRLRLECQNILNGQQLNNGEILVCNGYNLPCNKIITTVGPEIINKVTKQDEKDLYNCYKNSLEYAIKNSYKSIAFPSISTGLFKYPISKAKLIALNSVKEVLKKYDTNIKVIFVLYSEDDYYEYQKMFKKIN